MVIYLFYQVRGGGGVIINSNKIEFVVFVYFQVRDVGFLVEKFFKLI